MSTISFLEAKKGYAMGQESALVGILDSSEGNLTNFLYFLPEKDRENLIIKELEALPPSIRVRILLALIEPNFTRQDSATMIELIVRLRQE